MKEQTTEPTEPTISTPPPAPTKRSRRSPFELTIFCLTTCIIASLAIIFGSVLIIEPIGLTFVGIGAAGLAVSLLVILLRFIPTVVKTVYTALLCGLALALALNFLLPDESSTVSYPGYYKSRHITTSQRGGKSYHVIYASDRGRTYTTSVSEDDYYLENYPDQITMKEQRGLLGWEIEDTDNWNFYERLRWLLLALGICLCEGIWLYSRYTIDFRRSIATTAIVAQVLTVGMMRFAPSVGAAVLSSMATVFAAGVCFVLMANYHRCERGAAQWAVMEERRKVRNRSGKRAPYNYVYRFSVNDGEFEFKWGEDRSAFLGPITTDALPVRIDRGCFGMRVVKPI